MARSLSLIAALVLAGALLATPAFAGYEDYDKECYGKKEGDYCEKDYDKCTIEKCYGGKCKKVEDKKCDYGSGPCLKKAGYCDAKEGCVAPVYYEDGYYCESDDDKCTIEKCYSGYCKVVEKKENCDKHCYGKKDGDYCDSDYNECTIEKCYYGKCKKVEDKKCDYGSGPCLKKAGYCDAKEGCVAPVYYEDGYYCESDDDKCTIEKCYYGKCKVVDKKENCDKHCYGKKDGDYCDSDYNECTIEKCYYGKCKKVEDKKCDYGSGPCLKKAGYCDAKEGCVAPVYYEDGYYCDSDNDKCTIEKCYYGKCKLEYKDKYCGYDEYCHGKEEGDYCDSDYNECTIEKCYKGKCTKVEDKKCDYGYNYDKECVKKEGYCHPKKGCVAPVFYKSGYYCDTDYNECTVEKCNKYGKCVKAYTKDKQCCGKKAGTPCTKDYNKCTVEKCTKDGYCKVAYKLPYCNPKGDEQCWDKKDGYDCKADDDKCTKDYCYKGYCKAYKIPKCYEEPKATPKY